MWSIWSCEGAFSQTVWAPSALHNEAAQWLSITVKQYKKYDFIIPRDELVLVSGP